MKKWILLCILSFTVVLSVFCQSGYILSASGTVWIENGNGVSEALAGAILENGDIVITGRNGRADLVIDNDESITLEQNSRYALNGEKRQKKGFLKKAIHGIWKIVSRKFNDTEYSNAAVGTVGAIRGPADAVIKNFELTKAEERDLAGLLSMIHPDPESPYLESEIVLIGPILESFYQFATAETMYKQGIKTYPEQTLIYDMLIDLYMNNELYEEASDFYEQRISLTQATP
jgi:tetratricopeptide (TPR) repeat protein